MEVASDEAPAGGSTARAGEDVAAVLAHSLKLSKRLLSTNLTAGGRAGQPAVPAGFDGKLFRSELKKRLFDAVEPLWDHLTGAGVAAHPALTASLFDLGVLFLKNDADGLSPPEVAAPVAGVAPPRPPMVHDPATVTMLVEMGFEARRVRQVPLSRSHAFSLTHTHSHSHTLTLSHSFTHTHTHSQHTLTISL